MSQPVVQLAQVVEGIGEELVDDESLSKFQREYLRNRWHHEIRWFARATRRSKRLHLFASIVAVASGALTACAAGLNVFMDDRAVSWLIAGMGVLTAVSSGLSGRFKDWENWKRRSMTLERLKSEGRQFHLLAGVYEAFQTKADAFKAFAANVEKIVADHKQEFFARNPALDHEPTTAASRASP